MEEELRGLLHNGVSSTQEFLHVIELITQSKDGKVLWYRGEKEYDYFLIPSLYRPDTWGKTFDLQDTSVYEKSGYAGLSDPILNEFKRRAYPFLNSYIPRNDLEWMFLGRHYGLPTRLLDWSESALVALWFALEKARMGKDAAIWIIDPHELNELSTGSERFIFFSPRNEGSNHDNNQRKRQHLNRRIVDAALSAEARNTHLPIALYSDHVDARIANQKGCFTLHGYLLKGFEFIREEIPHQGSEQAEEVLYQNYRSYLVDEAGVEDRARAYAHRHEKANSSLLYKLRIPSDHINRLKQELRLLGIKNSFIYPDLNGLCAELRDDFFPVAKDIAH